MYKCIFPFLFLGEMILPAGAWAGDISLTAETDKQSYAFGELIWITLTVRNGGTHAIALWRHRFECPGAQLFVIQSPRGQKIHSARRYGRRILPDRPQTIVIEAGQSHTVSFNLMDHYPAKHLFASPHNFDEPGTYELIVRYYVEQAERAPEYFQGVFLGPVESEPIRFTVRPLEGERLEELLEQLKDEGVDAKCEAIDLLRRGRALEHIPNGLLLEFVRNDQPHQLRISAARAVRAVPSADAWESYAEYLDDPDALIRSYMATTLGKIGNKVAGDALYAVTDPEKYPWSYTSAFRALIDIGDLRAREVAVRLEKDAPEALIREMASKFLRGELDQSAPKERSSERP